MTLQIIGFPRSNFVHAVRMVAEEKGVTHELLPETPHSEAIKAVNPTEKFQACAMMDWSFPNLSLLAAISTMRSTARN